MTTCALTSPAAAAPAALVPAPAALEPALVAATVPVSAGCDVPVTGNVHSWDVSTGVDGPGTRFVAFLAGCPLRCLYCHNPDTWSGRSGERLSSEELVDRVARYRRFIEVSSGGVTLSGGEPLTQPAFVADVLRRCKALGLHTAIDTSGAVGHLAPDTLLDDVDLVLLDIKSWGEARYRELTGGDIAPTLTFARRLAERGTPVHLRFVAVPGHTTDPEVVDGVARFAASLGNVERVDVLPVHRLATAKYEALGRPDPLAGIESPDAALLDLVRSGFAAHGLSVV